MLVEMSTAVASKSTGTVLKKSINSLKVPKKAINECKCKSASCF